MTFLIFMKIVFILTVICSSTKSEDIKFEKLKACLIKAGVEKSNIIYRDSDGYSDVNWQWNCLNGTLKPMAYVLAASVSDVQNAVICSRSSDIRIVARSGGRSYVKNSFGDSDSLIVDLAKLNETIPAFGGMSCEIGAGVKNYYAKLALSERKLFIPLGIHPFVGISGLALGGGYGYFTRQYGLTTDQIMGLEMVDANGKLLVINDRMNADLFFALRGGGGGSYGIVTKFKFATAPAPDSVVLGTYNFAFGKEFSTFFKAYQSLITEVPYNVGTIIKMEKKRITLEIYFINVLERMKGPEEITKLMDKFSFPKPTSSNITVLSYPTQFLLMETQNYFDPSITDNSQLGDKSREEKVIWKKVKSFYVNKILDDKQISNLHILLREFLKVNETKLAFLQNGGEMDTLSRSESAFVHRGNLYDIQTSALNWEADSAAKIFFKESKNIFDHQESYQNYLDPDIKSDHLERYYAEQLDKLVKIKRKYDPNNVFRHPQSIPTEI